MTAAAGSGLCEGFLGVSRGRGWKWSRWDDSLRPAHLNSCSLTRHDTPLSTIHRGYAKTSPPVMLNFIPCPPAATSPSKPSSPPPLYLFFSFSRRKRRRSRSLLLCFSYFPLSLFFFFSLKGVIERKSKGGTCEKYLLLSRANICQTG